MVDAPILNDPVLFQAVFNSDDNSRVTHDETIDTGLVAIMICFSVCCIMFMAWCFYDDYQKARRNKW